MKIAVTHEQGGLICQHFGQTKQFKVYTVADGAILDSAVIGTGDKEHCAVVDVLKTERADVLICGGLGQGAIAKVTGAGIKLYPGVTGVADDAVKALLAGTLDFNPDAVCSEDHAHHHEHGHEHGHCGGHHHG